MRKLFILGAMALAIPALADTPADLSTDMVLGKTLEEVQASLTSMGYEVRKSEVEDGMIEAYVVRDDSMAEIYVSPKTGKLTRIKAR
ncbi:MAG: PepSY domain-containing protein [Alphaproteobacteria bacterium]|nr:MAG: PepSY domain-containing protein [Alphaproteobacteria bacterium]